MATSQSIVNRKSHPLLDRLPSDSLRRPHPFVADDGTNCFRVQLTQGQFALIDECDVPGISKNAWSAEWNESSQTFYAAARAICPDGKRRKVAMHIVLSEFPDCVVDHRNRNGLDNRRNNIRVCSQSQNVGNSRKPRLKNATSKFKGVSLNAARRRWYAKIKHNGKSRHIASCDTALQAALKYDSAALAAFGEFAKINFPERRGR